MLPTARVGGPASTGPDNPKAAAFLEQFLEHCAHGTNHATGNAGAPLDFITYHAKGAPEVVEGHVRMGLSRNIKDVAKGIEIVTGFPQFKKLPIILSECDPEGCAACSARLYPHNAYRNGTLYPTYTAVALSNILKLADRYHANIEGVLTWAFEFEDQPYFDGFRTLATNGIDKPGLNLFRMAGLMQGDRVQVTSTGAVGLDTILQRGVRGALDIDALASRSDRNISILVWNYQDNDLPAPQAVVNLTVSGVLHLPSVCCCVTAASITITAMLTRFGSNWALPRTQLESSMRDSKAASQLQLLDSPQWVWNQNGRIGVKFTLPHQSLSLLQLSW